MITYELEKDIADFVAFLNAKGFTTVPCRLVILPDHDTVESMDGRCGFASYVLPSQVIYLPMAAVAELSPEDQRWVRWQNLAHEYWHHVQHSRGVAYCGEEAENEAQEMAEKLVAEFATSRSVLGK